MNIDERLEALAQSLELLVSSHKDNERHMAETRGEMKQGMDGMRQGMEGLREAVKSLIENNNRLSNIIIAHDGQLDHHEKRLGDLER